MTAVRIVGVVVGGFAVWAVLGGALGAFIGRGTRKADERAGITREVQDAHQVAQDGGRHHR